MKKMRFLDPALALAAGILVLAGCAGEAPEAETEAAGEAAPTPAAPAAAPAAPLGTASITGTVTYEGAVPNLPPVSMGADPACQAKHTEPVANPVLVLGDGNTLGNVFVRVTSGLPGRDFAAPSEPVVIDQQGCEYIPHVVGLVEGQELKFLNSDGILHNVHALPQRNQEFNMAMPAERKEASHTFQQPEDMFRIKCDVHPWMNAWVSVLPHPYFATTGRDGRFEISGLPAGTYEVELWHERLGTSSQTVTVADGETASVDAVLSRTGG